MPDIDHVSITFGNGVKRAEYDPIKKCEVTISARVGENEDGVVILAQIGTIAIAKVADMLSAPKPAEPLATSAVQAAADEAAARPPRRGRPPKDTSASVPAATTETGDGSAAAENTAGSAVSTAPIADEEWSTETAPGGEVPDSPVTDDVLLKTMSQAAERLGGKDKVKALLATFATRTEGAPFKAQEIAQPYRQDFLAKLAALT